MYGARCGSCPACEGRRSRPRHEFDPAARRRRRRRPHHRDRPPARDHTTRRGRRRTTPPPPHIYRPGPWRPRGLRTRGRSARRRARAGCCHERCTRRRQRSRVPGRPGRAVRFPHPTPRRRRGGRDDVPRRHVRSHARARDAARRHRRRLHRARRRWPAGVGFTTSLQAGCVRLTERFLHSDPPSGPELDAAAAHIRSLLPTLDVSAAIGVAGTITTVAAIDLGLAEYDATRIHGHRISVEAAGRVLRQLASLPLAERREVAGLRAGTGAGHRRRPRRAGRGDGASRARHDRGERAGHPAWRCTRRRGRREGPGMTWVCPKEMNV